LNIVVAGGRNYSDYDNVKTKLDNFRSTLKPGTKVNIISGAASGADSLGERYARENNLGLQQFPANWNEHGRAAGPIRNQEMAGAGDILFAFPGGAGTTNMISNMNRKGKRVFRG